MNYIKNELRSTLTQTNLNAAIAIGSENRTVTEFPIEKVANKYRCNYVKRVFFRQRHPCRKEIKPVIPPQFIKLSTPAIPIFPLFNP